MRSTDSGDSPAPEQVVHFRILDQRVRIKCRDLELGKVLLDNFGAMAGTPEVGSSWDLGFEVRGKAGAYSVLRSGHTPQDARDFSDLLFVLEKDLIVEVQKRRPDRLFLHAAALDWKGRACLLAGDTGSGKSLVTWALLHNGFAYLSDELSPVDLDSLHVAPYPHALCLKQQPPPSHPLPGQAIHLGRTIHIPVAFLPAPAIPEPRPLGAVFFLRYGPELREPDLRAIGPAEAGARLYLNALNALSHPDRGLDAVLRIARQVPAYTIASAGLDATCALIRDTMENACSQQPGKHRP